MEQYVNKLLTTLKIWLRQFSATATPKIKCSLHLVKNNIN